MSIAAITWASKLAIKPSSVKFVLIAMADCANEQGLCFPSIEHVCAFTSQDRKTVITAISRLEEMGYLRDIGERRGRTRQVKVYCLKNAEIGTVPDSEPPPKSTVIPENSAVFPSKESRFSVETVPETAHGTVKEPSKEPSKNKEPASPDVPRETELADADEIGQAGARVFAHWRQTWGHPRAVFDAKRRKLVRARLRDYSEADLCLCISGYLNSPWHTGKNPSNTVYDSIELLLRDAGQVDRGLQFYHHPPRTDLSEKTRRIIDQTDGWVPPEMRMNA